LSIPNQRLLLDRHIESLDIDGAEVLEFVDNGHTGTNFERPGVQELLGLVRESKVDCIAVKDFSRFGRNSIETGYFIERVFPLFRTRFIAVSDNFDSADYKEDTGGMEVAFKFLMHEYYSVDMSRKEKSAKYAKFKRGEYQSAICPYGYQKAANGRMEPDPETADVVRLIFDLALEMKTADIVKALYEKRIVTPGEYKKANGKGFHDVSRSIGIWQNTTILRMLTDERYTGTYVIGKRAVTEIGGGRVRMKDESEWVKIPDHHPAIISRETYERVNAAMLHFKCPKTEQTYTALRGKVFCGCCNHAMQIVPRKVRAFYCRYTKSIESAECHKLEIGEQELENLLYETISKQAKIIMSVERTDVSSGFRLKTAQQAEYGKSIEKCRDEKRSLYEKLILGELDAAGYMTKKAEIDAELGHLTRVVAGLNAETSAMSAAKSAGDDMRELAGTALGENKLTRPLVDLLIDKVYVYPDNRVEIMWRVADFAANIKEGSENVR
jgi:DNA invertase Pin-like site-specific DNA recombinase